MKQKCSFILKASISLVLALLMLFGTMATSIAAVVENADTGAKADLASTGATYPSGMKLYIKPSSDWKSSGAKFKVYVWDDSNHNANSAVATQCTFDTNYYVATVPSGYTWTHYKWRRMASDGTTDWGWASDDRNNNGGAQNAYWNEGWESNGGYYNIWVPDSVIYFDGTKNTSWDGYSMFTKGSNSGTTGGVATTKIATHLYKYTFTSMWDNCNAYWWRGSNANTLWNYSKGIDPGDYHFSGKNAVATSGSGVTQGDSGTASTVAVLSLTSISAPTLSATTLTPTYGDSNTVTASGNTLNYSFNGSARTTTLLSTDAVYNFYVDGSNTPAQSSTTKTYDASGLSVGSHTITCKISSSLTGLTSSTGSVSITVAAPTHTITLSESGASGGTLQVDGANFTSGSTVTEGNHTFRVDAPSGYNISSISGIGSWTNNTSYATLGSTNITADKTISVTYVSAGTCGFSLSSSSATLNIGGTTTFTVTPNGYHSSGTISASSNDTSVATVSYNSSTKVATVTAVAPGTATITVSCTDTGNTPATFSVTVNTPTISVGNNTTLLVGGTYTPSPSLANPSDTGSGWTVVYTRTSGTTASVAGSTITGENYGAATTFKASFQYNGVEKAYDTFTVTPATPTVSLSNYSSINIGGTSATPNPTVTNVSSLTKVYSITSGAAYATINSSTGVVTGVAPGNVTVKLAYKKGGTEIISDTATITVTAPTVTVTSGASVLVDGTLSLTASSSGATTTPSYSWSVAAGTGTASVAGSTLTGKTPGTVTVTVTATYNASYSTTATKTVTVTTPSISVSGGTSFNVAKGNTKQLSASTSNPSGLTITYAIPSAVTGITVTSSGLVTVTAAAADNATATVVATAKNSDSTAVKTQNITITAKAPALVVKGSGTPIADDGDLYMTVGGNLTLDTSDTNFTDDLYFKSSNTSVATINRTTGEITAVSKGTTTITVTTDSTLVPVLAGRRMTAAKYKNYEIAATGAVAAQTMTFTLNVSEDEDYKLILLTANKDSNNWNTAYIYYQYKIGSNPTQTVTLTNMPKIAVNDGGNNVFGYRMPIEHYNNLTLIIFNENSSFGDSWRQTADITTKSNGYYLTTTYDGNNKRTVGTWTHSVKIPQITVSPDPLNINMGSTASATMTNVTDIAIGKGAWTSSDTSKATVTGDEDGATVTGVAPTNGTPITLTGQVWAAKPYNTWTTWTMDATTLAVIGNTATASVNVTADDKSITFGSTYDRYTTDGSSYTAGTTGGSLAIEYDDDPYISGTDLAYGSEVTVTATAEDGYTVDSIQYSTDGTTWNNCDTASTTSNGITTEKTINEFEVDDNYYLRANFKKVYYLTLYNSYVEETGFTFDAAPPRSVVVGDGTTTRATYTYAAGTLEQRGEDNQFANDGTASETHIVGTTGKYYEGNKLVVFAGEQVKLNYATLSSSDAIMSVNYINGKRYTTDLEDDNLYKNRVYKAAGWEGYTSDDWYGTSHSPFTYLAATDTIYADAGYFSGATASTISGQTYPATVNQSTHVVTIASVTKDYYNIDIQRGTKSQIKINNDDYSGIGVTGLNTEGYYFTGEQVGKIGAEGTELKVTLDTSDSSCSYSFTGVNTVKDEDDNNVAGFTITAYNSSNAVVADPVTNKASVTYYKISCSSMPSKNVFITIGVLKTYKMRLSNAVVSDTIGNKVMINQTNGTTYTSGATGESSGTGHIGTVKAFVNFDGEDDGSGDTDIAYENNSTYHWYYPTGGTVVEDNTYSHNYYLKRGGVNKAGSDITAGDTVTYKFTFASGMDANYSFVGWFEGSLSDSVFTPDYTKKLSAKTSFTYTPSKNTVVIAVATRDVYIGGTFNASGEYSTTTTTWSQNRIRMSFDPTYVNGANKGRYYYEFTDVDANKEYKFRCYDTVGTGASGQDSANLTAWTQWDGATYAQNNDDILMGRTKYAGGSAGSHGAFVFKTNSTSVTLSENTHADATSTKNHESKGYGDPVIVYFYAYDGGISVNSTYQWAKAYVSAGAAVDCTNYEAAVGGTAATWNSPTVSVANTTVNSKTVSITNRGASYFGGASKYEAIKECQVQEPDGQIVVTASPADANMELQAFVCYNIDTKDSWAVYDFTSSTPGSYTAATTYTGNIEIPQNSKVYVVPVYKFTDAYIEAYNLETHTVYVRTEDIDKDDWGGLVAMYSWGKGTTASGDWPGQLMIPSDDGTSFYAPLTFGSGEGDLVGVNFNNYAKMWSSAGANFLSTYVAKGVSSTAYSGYDGSRVYQGYDYREPISIIDNFNEGVYGSEELTLTFALKPGNKNGSNFGSNTYSAAGYDWEYLTDRSGKNRVDLNGNVVGGTPTASYYVVCNYTEGYAQNTETYAPHTSTRSRYAINWTVYDTTGTKVAGGNNWLSASYTDVTDNGEGGIITEIANEVVASGAPVDGKAVMIAYEDPQISNGNNLAGATLAEAARYSGQWYADSVNTIINVSVDVGVVADGVYKPSGSCNPGYATGSVSLVEGTSPLTVIGNADKSENFTSAYPARVTLKHATDKKVKLHVNTTENFQGWFIYDEDADEYKLQSTEQDITPSFNSDTTYYAFYSARATYVIKYPGRRSTLADENTWLTYTAYGEDLEDSELAVSGVFTAKHITDRNSDIHEKLDGFSDNVTVFGREFTVSLDATTSPAVTVSPYTLTYKAAYVDEEYDLNIYAYNKSGSLALLGSISGNYGTTADVTVYKDSLSAPGTWGAAGQPVTLNGSGVFLGWYTYNPDTGSYGSERLSSRPNYGFGLTKSMTIAPKYGTQAQLVALNTDTWGSYIDHNEITQELTDENSGKIYNDSLIRFTYSSDSSRAVSADGCDKCGIVILAQKNTASSSQKTSFTALGSSNLQNYVLYLNADGAGNTTTPKAAAKLNSTNYGDAYAYKVSGLDNLSDLNRVNISQILNYADYTGGNYKVIAYARINGTYYYSDVIDGVYTPGVYPAA